MNAKALLALIDECGMIELVNRSGRDIDGWIQETILRALRLLAAAEANDGSTPETDAIEDAANGAFDCNGLVTADFARLLERERNALSARVRELEPDAVRLEWIETKLFDKHWNGVIDSGSKTHWRIGEGYRHIMREMIGHTFRSAIDAARSK